MNWIRNDYAPYGLAQTNVQSRVEWLSMKPNFSDYLMVEHTYAKGSTVWIRLPKPEVVAGIDLVALFPEFHRGNESDLPKEAALIVGDVGEFERLFSYPKLTR